ncbi:MAG: hypothetical protein HC767_11945 [Akkermansiaceae bacterium]|nr:hypothetical protein [Akkermansiaceae bacterium]
MDQFEEDSEVDSETTLSNRVRLNFDTSFTGNDLLRARLQARDFNVLNSFGATLPGNLAMMMLIVAHPMVSA